MEPPKLTRSTLSGDLQILADQYRRLVLGYLLMEADTHAHIDELVEHIRSTSEIDKPPDPELIRTELHHNHLPQLSEHGIITYDARSGDVRYHSMERIERILECIGSA